MKMDLSTLKDSQAAGTKTSYPSYLIDFFFFVSLVLLFQQIVFGNLYAFLFVSEGGAAFMQFTHYIEALTSNSSLYWDHYLMLSSQEMPTSPLLSPVTLILIGTAFLFDLSEPESLIYIFAFAVYLLQVLCCYTMYLFLRFEGLSRLAAIAGGVGYGFNFFTMAYGMQHGFFRLSAMALIPIVFIYFVRLFSNKNNSLYYLTLSGFLLGVAFVFNGDVKPTIYFIPVLVILAYVQGCKVHGTARTSLLLFGVMALGALITFAQFYPTLEALGEGVRSERTRYLPLAPLNPFNTILGFSQNPFSFTVGFIFPHSIFEYYKHNFVLGIASTHIHEQKFTYGIYLFLVSTVGIFYRTKRHLIWALSFLIFMIYLLGSSTPLWPIVGFISKHIHIRYPTRAAIMPYFFISIYVAYGLDVLFRRRESDFYKRWAARYIIYISAFLLVIIFALTVTTLEFHYAPFGVLGYTDKLTLFVSRLLVFVLFSTLLSATYICWRSTGPSGSRGPGNAVLFDTLTRINGSMLRDFILYIFLHALACYYSLYIALNIFKLWLIRQGAHGGGLSVLHFAEASFPFAVIIFIISYIVISFFLVRGFKVLSPVQYVPVFLLSAAVFNVLFLLVDAERVIHLVHFGSLSVLAVIIVFMGRFIQRLTLFDYKAWIESPSYINYTKAALFLLFLILFVLFIFSGFMGSYLTAPDLVIEVGGVKFQKEFLIVFIGLLLFLLSVISGIKRATSALVLLLVLGAYFFFYTEAVGVFSIPPTIKADQSLVFKRDAELDPIYKDGRLDDLRIFIPRIVRREALSPELGFPKSHHTYCCRQYKDNLRFAFGQIVGPKALESIRNSLRGNYSHPFWKLYNVGYILDRFDDDPALLPKDTATYERLSDMVIKLKGTRALLYFMDSYEYMELDNFLEELSLGNLLDMEEKLYINDSPSLLASVGSPGVEASIEITDFRSGTLGALVTVDRPGFVLFSEVWAPSWTVYVDGERRSVLRAYGMLQAVWVEPGTHEITFKYNIFASWKMKAAALLSALAFLFVLAVVLRRFARGLDEADGFEGDRP